MISYKITHTTKYAYSEPVPVCHNLLHLAPRNLQHQNCRRFALLLSPMPPYQYQRVDYYGNRVDYFSIHVAHLGLTVTATSQVDVTPREPGDPLKSPAWESLVASVPQDVSLNGLSVFQFTFPSHHIALAPEFADYARQSFSNQRPILDAAVDLTRRINQDFRYDPKATTISTSLNDVLRGRAGVCQDFAHLQIACLRSLGVPARYVSGYLRTVPPPGKRRLIGADASHAWISVWCGPLGWIDLDPTNNLIPSRDHITVAWGRDYADVCPIQGVALGGGEHRMSVSVDVSTVPTDSAALGRA